MHKITSTVENFGFMHSATSRMTLLCFGGWMVLSVGCAPAEIAPGQASNAEPAASTHSHSDEGPHHGVLVELGSEYHAEVVHDDSIVTIYILDGSAKETLTIDAKQIRVNTVLKGSAEQFQVPAEARNDSEGSKFSLVDQELVALLDADDSEVKLSIDIHGVQYSATLKHGHGHGHSHDDTSHGHEH